MKARVTFTDSDGDSGTVDIRGNWEPGAKIHTPKVSVLLHELSSAANMHEKRYDATITKIEIEIIG
jgi:hypothetical protein